MADRVRPVSTVLRPVLVTVVVAAGLVAAWLAAPPMGTDLAAQVARADFFAAAGWAPVDLRWYGGVSPHGYSLVSPPLMAWLGPRPVGAGSAVLAAVAFVALLLRTAARRPLLGGVLGAVCFTGNLVSGRVTFALGVAIGLAALLALVGFAERPGWRWWSWGRYVAAGLLAALAAATSPVAGLFVGLAGVALGLGARRRWPEGAVLAVGAAVPVAAMAWLSGSGGWMNMSRADMQHAAVASLAVAVLVPHRVVRVGALLSAGGVVAAYLLTTPVGLNATRLATMFALPVVAAYAAVPGWLRDWAARRIDLVGPVARGWPAVRGWLAVPPAVWLVPVLAALVWWQPPVIYQDLREAGDPTAAPEFFAPLREELARRDPAGRVEVVPTSQYWESAYLDRPPLARGWLRQADTGRNPLFFDGSLDPDSYRRWLAGNGVSHVAVAAAPLSWVGRAEAELVRQGLPYLTLVWEDPHWQLYEVDGAPALVEGPAVVRETGPSALAFTATGPGEVLVRVRWSRWLAVTGPGEACLAPAGQWTTVTVPGPGGYELTGSLLAPGPGC